MYREDSHCARACLCVAVSASESVCYNLFFIVAQQACLVVDIVFDKKSNRIRTHWHHVEMETGPDKLIQVVLRWFHTHLHLSRVQKTFTRSLFNRHAIRYSIVKKRLHCGIVCATLTYRTQTKNKMVDSLSECRVSSPPYHSHV